MLLGSAAPAPAEAAGPAPLVVASSGGFWESFFGAGAARPTERRALPSGSVAVYVSLGSQTMTVSVGGEVLYRWPISSGRIGYSTPHGTYHPQRLAVMWRSHRFHMSPMPYSIFFRGGYAIHGTYATAYLGSRASHGCIRLSPGHAATLFSLVRGSGFGRTRITIAG
jgi:lipoprotein-anchoring transpeptidase ErfK/SrfK